MELTEIFKTVRDIPYRFAVDPNEENNSCTGKHEKLFRLLTKNGHEVRYRLCRFVWSSIRLPEEILEIPHNDNCNHVYIEVLINNQWIILDVTWDKELKDVFQVNEWDGTANTKIAVDYSEVYSPEESLRIKKSNESIESIKKDIEINGEFFKAFNKWLEEKRELFRKGYK